MEERAAGQGGVAIGLALPRGGGGQWLRALLPFLSLARGRPAASSSATPRTGGGQGMTWAEPRGWAPAGYGGAALTAAEAPAGTRTPAPAAATIPPFRTPAASPGAPTAPSAASRGQGPAAGEEIVLPALMPAVRWIERHPRGAWQPLLGMLVGRPSAAGPAQAGPQAAPPPGARTPGQAPVQVPPARTGVPGPGAPAQALTEPAVWHLPPTGGAPAGGGGTPGSPDRAAAAPTPALRETTSATPGTAPSSLTERVMTAPHPEARQWQPVRRVAPEPAVPAATWGGGSGQVPAATEHRPGMVQAVPQTGTAAELPWTHVDQAPPAAPLASPPAAPGMARRGEAAGEPGPYASSAAQGLALMTGAVLTIEHVVERRIEVEVTRQRQAIEATVAEQLVAGRKQVAEEMVSDGVARSLMQKMRSITREEQFRLGRVR